MALSLGGLFAIGMLTFVWVEEGHLQGIQNQAAHYQMALTQRIADDLDAHLEAAMAALDSVSSLVPAQLMDNTQAAHRWIGEREGLRASYFNYGLFLLRNDGSLVAMNTPQPRIAELPAFHDWVRKTVVFDEPLISLPFAIPLPITATNRATPATVLMVATPLAVGGVLVGIMGLERDGPLATAIGARMGENGYIYVADRAGHFLLGSSGKQISQTHVPTEAVTLAGRGVKEPRILTIGDDKVLATLTKLQTTGWVLGAHVPMAEAYAEADDLFAELGIFLLLGTLSAAGVTFGMMRLFARPIRALTEDVVRLGSHEGRLAPLPDRGGSAEIVRLTATFNALIARLDDDMEKMTLSASVFENVHEGIVVADPQSRVIMANRAFLEMTGRSLVDTLGQRAEFLEPEPHSDAWQQEMWRALNCEDNWQGEIWHPCGHGDTFPARLHVQIVRDPRGNPLYYLAILSNIAEVIEARNRLELLATSDPLTSLPNRALFNDRLTQALAYARRREFMTGIALIDLDGFKHINDQGNHHTGDLLLMEVANRLKSGLRTGDTVARLGGDEFALLISEVTDIGQLTETIARLRVEIARPYFLDGHEISIATSVGVTIFPADDADPDTLLRHADQAMCQAKNEGRNRVVLFDVQRDNESKTRHERRIRLREALQTNEVELYYQPKVNMRTGQVIGAEALLRWRHPEQGLLSPAQFLEEFANDDITIDIGEWVMERALRQMATWQREDGIVLPVGINLTARHLVRTDFVLSLREKLTRFPGLQAEWLEIEVLESDVLQDLRHVQRTIEACRALGVRFAIDDFGTGYSSLAYLKNIPADTLKVDRTFIRDMLIDSDDRAIVQGVISLAEVFQREVVAEGVESSSHEEILLNLGCDLGQGFGIARPMPPGQIPRWVKEYHARTTDTPAPVSPP